MDSLVKTLVDNSHKTLKILKKELVDNDEMLDIVKRIIEVDRTIDDLKKKYSNEIKSLEEALLNYMGEKDLKTLKRGFPDKRKYLTKKIADPYEYFNSFDDYQKPVDKMKKEDFFSKLKNKCPEDEEIQRTMKIIKRFNIRIGGEKTQLY